MVEFNVQWQIIEFNQFVAMRTIDARMVLLCVLIQLLLRGIAFNAFGFDAFEWHQQMDLFGVTVQFVLG